LSSTINQSQNGIISHSILYTSSKLGEGTWNSTTEVFFSISWQNQVHAPPSNHFSDGQKRIMLQNAVNGIMELRQVKTTADQMGTTSGSTLSNEEYTTLLLLPATAYDDQFTAKKAKHHVMMHDIQPDDTTGMDDGIYPDKDASFDIDCAVSSI
jgi:hypothetical protein